MKKRIIRRALDESLLPQLTDTHPVLRRVYVARGIKSAIDLEHELSALHPFQSLMDIDKAVDYLAVALQAQKRIAIIGDFDADGATSCALAVSALRLFGAKHVTYLVPNRFEYGYGLTPEIVELAAQWQPDVLITVDNGITSCAGVATANAMGMSVLITDHHLPGSELPQALAIVNPNQVGDQFPSKNLAGVGVIFYVMLALRRYLCEQDWFAQHSIPIPNMAQLLDLVAVGTVADVVPLDKNNRILVAQGLRRIRAGKCRPGISALLAIAKREQHMVTATDLGFAVAPRLNAAGRLQDMSLGIECLLSDDNTAVQTMASQLNDLNVQRRAIEADMQMQANAALRAIHIDQLPPTAICLYQEDWHQGVIGILAGRLKDQLHRPVIIFAKVSEHELKGSGRSIAGVNMRDMLAAVATAHPDLIVTFGGHAMAAGLTIKIDNFTRFSKAFTAQIARTINTEQLLAQVLTDGQLTQDDFKLTLAEMIRDAGPWGQHFPEPVFEGQFAIVDQKIVAEKHLKLQLALPASSQPISAIAFNINAEQWPNYACTALKAVYRLGVNHYRGTSSLQLVLEYFEPCASA